VEDDDNANDDRDVLGHLVNATGPLAPSAQIPITAFTAGERDNVSVASDGNGWLVTYGHRPTGSEPIDVIGRRIDASGVPVGGQLALGTGPTDQRDPSAAWGGVYFVAWRSPTSGGPNDLWGNRVTSDGTVVDGPAGVNLTSTPSSDEFVPALAQAPGYQQWTMAYQLNAGIWERPVSK
jgi:hypothetical protein